MRKIGGHVSAAGGVDKAVERAAAIGANCVQVFSGSPRVWARPSLDALPLDKIFSKQQELSISPIITHAIYLTNLASDNPELVTKSRNVLIYDLTFDSLVKGSGVVVHLGSHQGRGWDSCEAALIESLKFILDKTPDNSTFLIENSAGQNGKLCSNLSEIKRLIDGVGSDRLGWCFDTCHGHAAGYSLGKTIQPGGRDKRVVDEIAELKLWDSLKCIHVNDSRDPFGSGRDRHDNLGDGLIGFQVFEEFLNQPELLNKPLIMEVPGIDGNGPDAENIERLKKLVK